MPKLGKEHYIIRLISAKTKIKKEDVLDVFKALPQCLAEAFFEENPAEKEGINFGAFTMYWRTTGLGPSIFFFPSTLFKEHVVRLKYEGNTELAAKLYGMMIDTNRQRTEKKFANLELNNVSKNKKKTVITKESAEKHTETRRKLVEKRKLQKKQLKNTPPPTGKW